MTVVGGAAPNFTLIDFAGQPCSLSDFKGKLVVLYCYPKDNTKGCTDEALDFTYHADWFEKNGVAIIGISPDSVKSHANFVQKYNLKVKLLSDPDKKILSEYGVWQMKKACGRECMGVVRSTFVVSPEGILVLAWRNVKVKGHVDEVKLKLSELVGHTA